MTRPDWDEYFLNLADMVSNRSTCLRLKVGCVIVAEDNRVLATGYNGSPKGLSHCLDDGCLMNEENRCVRTIHAEVNAILTVDSLARKNAILYCTHEPCENCTKIIIQSGIKKVVFRNHYTKINPNTRYFNKFIDWVHIPNKN